MLLLFAGTRPEIIKLAPVVWELKKQRVPFRFVVSGQHYNVELVDWFLKDCKLSDIVRLSSVKEEDPVKQLRTLISRVSAAIRVYKPSVVVVHGDTNTTLAAALSARKYSLKLCHVEAGLRSYDWRQPEEHNRIVVDHISDELFIPTVRNLMNLTSERVSGTLHLTGNPIVEAVKEFSKYTENPVYSEYVYLTLHRAETVDNESEFRSVISAIGKSEQLCVWPIHPRAEKRLAQFNIALPKNIITIKPVNYVESLSLLKYCKFVATDSGGLVEEATVLQKPVVILRKFNDRPEAVSEGFATMTYLEEHYIIKHFELAECRTVPKKSPYGDGKASKRIVRILEGIL